ncbi:ORF6N domain-containing protein [Chitinophaga sp. OAE865]|uniref:ORF6N domain-containing protein n=1 Tax=Chitinophaga sp. OAE865 TaxID=2817898 RepID=UPI001AE5C92E
MIFLIDNLLCKIEKSNQSLVVPEEKIIKRIVILKDENVIPGLHLAELYGVGTRALKQAVRRNVEHFPEE